MLWKPEGECVTLNLFIRRSQRETISMLQLILAGSFVAMILTPALVAAAIGKKESDPEPATAVVPARRPTSRPAKRVSQSAALSVPAIHTPAIQTPAIKTKVGPVVRYRNPGSIYPSASNAVLAEVSTLPLHRTMSLAGR